MGNRLGVDDVVLDGCIVNWGLRVTYAVTLEWNERERPKNGTLSLEKSAASLEKVRESAVILEKVLFTLL